MGTQGEQDELRERLERYRRLLRETSDRHANAAIIESIKQIESRLNDKGPAGLRGRDRG